YRSYNKYIKMYERCYMFGKPKESVRFLDFNDVAEKFGEKKAVAIFDAIAGKKSKEHIIKDIEKLVKNEV
ncbi:hypothetical protein KWT29_07660, partial [Clostridioides difficile]|nr:hypothetical protein [Clostridioides difficile]